MIAYPRFAVCTSGVLRRGLIVTRIWTAEPLCIRLIVGVVKCRLRNDFASKNERVCRRPEGGG